MSLVHMCSACIPVIYFFLQNFQIHVRFTPSPHTVPLSCNYVVVQSSLISCSAPPNLPTLTIISWRLHGPSLLIFNHLQQKHNFTDTFAFFFQYTLVLQFKKRLFLQKHFFSVCKDSLSVGCREFSNIHNK